MSLRTNADMSKIKVRLRVLQFLNLNFKSAFSYLTNPEIVQHFKMEISSLERTTDVNN